MSHMEKVIGLGEATKGVCICGYVGTITALRLHKKVRHGGGGGGEIVNKPICKDCGVVTGGRKELIKHINIFHKLGASGSKLV